MPSHVEVAHVQHRVLGALESAHNYNAWIASLARPYLGDDPIEIGSGRGTFARLWLDSGVGRLTLTELDPTLVDHLRERFAGDERVSVRQLDLLQAPDAEHSALVALNVLEHIEDDVAALRGTIRLLRPGAAVVLFVPAFGFAMSRFDRAIGHFRRYTSGMLEDRLARAGLRTESVRYVNAPGLLAWTIGMRLLRMDLRDGAALRLWDRAVIPWLRRIESHWSPPFGQSVLTVGRTAE
jgi:SAM-dependent methyltransferase